MPYALIPTALGASFFLVWLFIGGMIFRDGQLAAQQEREASANILPLPEHRMARRKPIAIVQLSRSGTSPIVRAAS